MAQQTKLSKIALFNELLKDPDRKSLIRIITEFISLAIFHRSFPRHYFTRYLFKKGDTNIKDYFPNHFLYHNLKPFLNNKDLKDVVENKLFFNLFYEQFNISLPKILLYNHKKIFVVNDKYFEINQLQDFRTHLENIFVQNPSYDSIIIKRTYGSYGGDQVYKLFSNQLSSDNEEVEKIFSEVIKEGFLFQETVRQH
ncbi:MAG: hypothetical protein OEU76_06700, partial [Cyclobacteriaceae bacterium]|nr:hypothetical protein [Cyclobacteriaceae bacterium]